MHSEAKSGRQKLDSILNIARTTQNDSLSVACYSTVGRRPKYYDYLTAKDIIREGIKKAEKCKIENPPKHEGRQIVMTVGPK